MIVFIIVLAAVGLLAIFLDNKVKIDRTTRRKWLGTHYSRYAKERGIV